MQMSPTPDQYLAEALRFFNARTQANSLNTLPIFKRRLHGYQWGHHRDLTVELMPNLVLRVRDLMQSLDKPKFLSTLEALTAVFPTKMTAPEPLLGSA